MFLIFDINDKENFKTIEIKTYDKIKVYFKNNTNNIYIYNNNGQDLFQIYNLLLHNKIKEQEKIILTNNENFYFLLKNKINIEYKANLNQKTITEELIFSFSEIEGEKND